MLTYTVISCSVAVCVFSECCHLGLALFRYAEGIFPLRIALSLQGLCMCTAVYMCAAVVGKALVQVVRQANEPGLA